MTLVESGFLYCFVWVRSASIFTREPHKLTPVYSFPRSIYSSRRTTPTPSSSLYRTSSGHLGTRFRFVQFLSDWSRYLSAQTASYTGNLCNGHYHSCEQETKYIRLHSSGFRITTFDVGLCHVCWTRLEEGERVADGNSIYWVEVIGRRRLRDAYSRTGKIAKWMPKWGFGRYERALF